MRTGLAALATPLLLLTACSDQSTSPSANPNTVAASAARDGAPKFWETGATVANRQGRRMENRERAGPARDRAGHRVKFNHRSYWAGGGS